MVLGTSDLIPELVLELLFQLVSHLKKSAIVVNPSIRVDLPDRQKQAKGGRLQTLPNQRYQ